MGAEVDQYKRFLTELLFIFNADHPQQALRGRIQAAIEGDWDSAFLIPTELPKEVWETYAALGESDESKHTYLLSEDTSPSSKRVTPWD